MTSDDDRRWLAAAIRLGSRHNGQTGSNPAVGCILVRDGAVVGMGVTGPGGVPHGETEALAAAGERAKGAVSYVSLEPCNHYGRTPPCTNALIAAGVKRVVIALGDPDPRVSGAGIKRLTDAGVEVSFEPDPLCKRAAQRAHRGHVSRMVRARPFTIVKLALSADGAIGLSGHGQVAITGHEMNAHMHGLRSQIGAIAVGATTWRLDKPKLTVRLPGLEDRSPQRVVFSSSLQDEAAWVLSGSDLEQDLRDLAARGIGTLLVEGGASLARSFLDQDLVDELLLLRGRSELGEKGLRPFQTNPFTDLPGAGLQGWQKTHQQHIGGDMLWTLTPPQRSPRKQAA